MISSEDIALLQQRARDAQQRMTDLMASAPAQTASWDSGRFVRVILDNRGALERIEVSGTARMTDIATDLAGRITSAAQAAKSLYLEQLASANEALDKNPRRPSPPIEQAVPESDEGMPARNSDDLAESYLAMAAEARGLTAALLNARASAKPDTTGPVRFVIESGALVDCSIDPQWVAKQTVMSLNRAMADEVERASASRSEEADATAALTALQGRVNALAAEATRALRPPAL